jgi:hypothetical protein
MTRTITSDSRTGTGAVPTCGKSSASVSESRTSPSSLPRPKVRQRLSRTLASCRDGDSTRTAEAELSTIICRTGNGSLINYNGNEFGAGAVGSHGALLRLILRNKMVILKVDPLTEEPARDKNGLCIRVSSVTLCGMCSQT